MQRLAFIQKRRRHNLTFGGKFHQLTDGHCLDVDVLKLHWFAPAFSMCVRVLETICRTSDIAGVRFLMWNVRLGYLI